MPDSNLNRTEGGLRTVGVQKKSTADLPLVSIITVVLNGDQHLGQSIQSVLDQTYTNIELIIVDGGSSDHTLEIIRRYEERVDYWSSEPDAGIYDAMNKGIRLAEGELIGLLNADDFYEPSAVAAVVAQYLVHPVPQILYGNSYILREDLGLKFSFCGNLKYWQGMCFSHQAMFVHRDMYTSVGPYDSSLRIAGDYNFVVRAIRSGVRFAQVHAFLVNYRDSGLSSQSQLASMLEGRKVLRRYVSLMSKEHLIFLLFLGKSTVLLTLLRLMTKVCGAQVAAKASRWYLTNFVSSAPEVNT